MHASLLSEASFLWYSAVPRIPLREKRTLLAGNAHALLHMNEGFVEGVEGLSTCTWRQARLCFDSVSCGFETKWMKSKYKKAR